MADISNMISKGIGSPASVKFIVTFGLGMGLAATAITTLTVRDQQENLTVQNRPETMTY
jgi:hypothetical protein